MTDTTFRVEKRRLNRGTGLETLADLAAITLLVLGIITACALFLTFSGQGLLYGVSLLLGAFLQWLLFRCIAEHLRLQKRIAGLSFQGRITGPAEETVWACGKCGQTLYSDTRCDSCGAEIASDT